MSKRLVALLIAMVLCFGASVYADTAENADLLNELNLLEGTNKGYELEQPLTRAQAATFIVKLLGEQSTVLGSPKSVNAFSDVSGSEWFVPYLAYCYENGIVSGYPDGTFKPNKVVSEQEFLSMVLGSVNVKDTLWSQIFKTSYDLGLSTDAKEPVSFLRGDVVDIMTNSLTVKVVDTDDTVITRLVKKGVVSEDKAVSEGLMIKDELVSEIKSIDVISNTKIKINMNEKVAIDESDVVIIGEDGTEVEVEKVYVSKKTITVETTKMSEQKYTVLLSKVIDEQGISKENLSEEFKGASEVVVSNYFHVSTIKAVSQNVIHVTFTHPVNNTSALSLNYELLLDGKEVVDGDFNNLVGKVLANDEYTIAFWFKDYDLDENGVYTLKVDGDVQSIYGVEINDGKEEEFDFAGSTEDNNVINIADIDVIRDDYIRIRFTEELDSSSALKTTNYQLVNDKTGGKSSALGTYLTGTGVWSNREITVKFLINDSDDYTLTVDEVKDIFKVSKLDEYEYPISGIGDIDAPTIDFASAFNETYIVVYLSEPILASSLDSATIRVGGITPDKIEYDSKDPSRINLFMSSGDAVNSKETLTIFGLKTNYGLSFDNISYELDPSNVEVGDIYIEDAKMISDNQVLVKFTYDVSQTTSTSQVKLTYLDTDGDDESINVNSISFVDNKTAVIKANDIEENTLYYVEISNLYDITNDHKTTKATQKIEY
ncbi:S-layer homology domain-containing protein [Acidaminobacter sp. JC074]|uniref:S-layer homology domain-containing protein n=1 Tax=Acidaminobacter sp. JC074 TaxID=2530199 RepID=UPI001F115CF6|nr:S-layer homology domain-containing protein [Acidaminobacter sp. JC074]MCH4887400.1 S-layer homology domain-containing protein [Acidaminobacter sp. JC074]